MATMQVFNKDQIHFMNKGQIHQQTLRSQIHEALFNNQFNGNYVISSLPGLGKTHEIDRVLPKNNPNILKVEGNAGISSFTVDLATTVYLAKGQPIIVVLDDCDMLFEDKNLNVAKKMFDQTRALKYNRHYRSLKHMCTDLQFEAISSFGSDDKAGFSVPLDTVTFIILTNRHFPTVNEVQNAEPGSTKEKKLTDLYAIRRRTEYKEIEMSNDELWGYVANVVLNEKICEKFMPNISQALKEQMLTWCFNNWCNVSERNLSLIEKMTKDVVRYPNDYLDIWSANYL
jgi:hypothetical protein